MSLFCIILPLVQKALFTYKARWLKSGLSCGDFDKALDESVVTFSSIFTMICPCRCLWPISESLLRTIYCIFALRKMYLLNLLISISWIVLVPYGYRRGSVIILKIGEHVIIGFVNFVSHLARNGLGSAQDAEFREPFISVCVAFFTLVMLFFSSGEFTFDEARFTPVYKTVLMNINDKPHYGEEYEKVCLMKRLFGLSVDKKVTSTDDLPIFLSVNEFIDMYEGPSHGIGSDIHSVNVEECERVMFIARMKKVTRDDIVNFHVSMGYDPVVFDNEIGDCDLPSHLFIERALYDIALTLRRLYAYLFPVAFIFFATCLNTWFGCFVIHIEP